MAKWDIKDGFWRLDCKEGQEWNFCYVLPQHEGEPLRLVVPTSLQMGWIESPPYFGAASETSRDAAEQYTQTTVGTLPPHKFESWVVGDPAYNALPEVAPAAIIERPLRFLCQVYVDDFMSCVIPTTRAQLRHVSNATMMGIHDVFPPDKDGENDPISLKKLRKGEGRYALQKELLGFDFDGEEHTMWLAEDKRAALLTILHSWIRGSRDSKNGIPWEEFESVVSKCRHAFTSLPAGRGLMSACNRLMRKRPPFVYLHRNAELLTAIRDIRTLLRETIKAPTPCRELVASDWPDYIGVKDASGLGVGGVVFGEKSMCVPTVFRVEWPQDIKDALAAGKLTNSDLEMCGLLFLEVVMEAVCPETRGKKQGLFSDNSPTVGWVDRMAARHSLVAAQLLRALALRLKLQGACPLTPMHVAGKQNAMTDIPSRSFGSEPKWHCKSDADLLTLFNSTFPLPNQTSWTVFRLTSGMLTRVISILRMKAFTMEEWRRLPKIGAHTGTIGPAMSDLWEWTLTYRIPASALESGSSQDSRRESEVATLVAENKSALQQRLGQSRPLERRFPWPAKPTQQK